MLEQCSFMGVVEALEEGKIVRVQESYARREGLLIIRQALSSPVSAPSLVHVYGQKVASVTRGVRPFDEFRKPLRKNNVLADLLDNFHWLLLKKRKEQGLTRKEVAKSLQVPEYDLKLIENGVLPGDNFILVNKLQEYYKINLRKDGRDFTKPVLPNMRVHEEADLVKEAVKGSEQGVSGNEIELDE